MRRKRVEHSTSRAKPSKRSSAAGSRSMHTSVPADPIRPATSRAWPPSPNVQSTAVSPGCGSRSSISSPASTGTWVRVMSRRMAKALSDPGDLLVEGVPLLVPAAPVPDLEVVEVADDHDLPVDLRVLDQRLVERDPPGGVQLGVERGAREVARELAPFGAERVQVREEALRPALELVRHPDRHAGLKALGQNHSG